MPESVVDVAGAGFYNFFDLQSGLMGDDKNHIYMATCSQVIPATIRSRTAINRTKKFPSGNAPTTRMLRHIFRGCVGLEYRCRCVASVFVCKSGR